MVTCRYCGQKSRTGDLRCSNCGKPLSLLANDQSDPIFEKDLGQIHEDHFQEGNVRKGSIKWKYTNPEYNNSTNKLNNQNRGYEPSFDDLSHSQSRPDYYGHDDDLYRNKFNENIGQYRSSLDNNYNRKFEVIWLFIEWDVIVASSFIVIILTAVFNRIFPVVGYILALLISLMYVLTTTKNKDTLILAIPLSFITTSAISAFLSL
ncbi:MAG: zinc ribbon domain-containing protein [Methanobrevibacter sp. CfCl-M3]